MIMGPNVLSVSVPMMISTPFLAIGPTSTPWISASGRCLRALSRLISEVSVLAAQQADKISEIEINPVLVHPEGQGVTIVDALVVGKA